MVYAVILAGGKGERFWPMSRSGHPKQLLKITSDKTMLQETIDRVSELIPIERTLVVIGENIKKDILQKIPFLKEENLLIEPMGKNTCVAIGLAAAYLSLKDPQATMVILSSDHLIKPKERLLKILEAGIKVAQATEHLVTIGIIPNRPEIGYGYIELGDLLNSIDGISVYKVKSFKEKPNRTVAQQYYLDRQHLWNSGMFIWTVKAFLKAVSQFAPDISTKLSQIAKSLSLPQANEILRKTYQEVENISVDCAILEKSPDVLTIKADIIWDDIGSWLALERVKEKDRDNNVLIGDTKVIDTFESIVLNEGEGIITTLGVSDLVIVKTDDIVLVAHKAKIPYIKDLLSKLAGDKRTEKFL